MNDNKHTKHQTETVNNDKLLVKTCCVVLFHQNTTYWW